MEGLGNVEEAAMSRARSRLSHPRCLISISQSQADLTKKEGLGNVEEAVMSKWGGEDAGDDVEEEEEGGSGGKGKQ